jgi:protease I
MPMIQDAQILMICSDGVEQVELTTPRDELRERGAKVDVATPTGRSVRAWNLTDWGDMQPADLKMSDVDIAKYDALVIPGGVINPDKLRIDPEAMGIVDSFVDSDKLIAAVCHGPWLLVQADACDGLRMTSWPSVRMDVENAGADWIDEEVVVDGRFVTSRKPDDLPAFVATIADQIENFGEQAAAR